MASSSQSDLSPPLLHKGWLPLAFSQGMFSFFAAQEAGTCFLLDLGVSADLSGLRQNKMLFLKTIQNNARDIYSCKTNQELGKSTFCHHLSHISPNLQ